MKHGKLVRPNNALPGPAVGYAQSLRQHRQAWGSEIKRRRSVAAAGYVRPWTLTDWYDALDGLPRPSVVDEPAWITGPDGTPMRSWRAPLMMPSDDLTRLEPGRLEAHRGALAWDLVQADEEFGHLEQFGRVSFRLQLLEHGFSDDLIEQAFEASKRGALVQVSRSIERMGSALLIDGVEVGTDRWSAAVMGHHLVHGPGASGA